MSSNVEYLDFAFPYGLALKYFFYWRTARMAGRTAVQMLHGLPEFIEAHQLALLTSSSYVQKSRSIPMAIAGVIRIDR